jgi:hypothetical protein
MDKSNTLRITDGFSRRLSDISSPDEKKKDMEIPFSDAFDHPGGDLLVPFTG